jgi:hypothetical protein
MCLSCYLFSGDRFILLVRFVVSTQGEHLCALCVIEQLGTGQRYCKLGGENCNYIDADEYVDSIMMLNCRFRESFKAGNCLWAMN